jgi:hypothetical protein
MLYQARSLSFRNVRVSAQLDSSSEESLGGTGKTDEREVFSVKMKNICLEKENSA